MPRWIKGWGLEDFHMNRRVARIPLLHVFIVYRTKWHWNIFLKNSVWSVGWHSWENEIPGDGTHQSCAVCGARRLI
jgi:hypothetical protein